MKKLGPPGLNLEDPGGCFFKKLEQNANRKCSKLKNWAYNIKCNQQK